MSPLLHANCGSSLRTITIIALVINFISILTTSFGNIWAGQYSAVAADPFHFPKELSLMFSFLAAFLSIFVIGFVYENKITFLPFFLCVQIAHLMLSLFETGILVYQNFPHVFHVSNPSIYDSKVIFIKENGINSNYGRSLGTFLEVIFWRMSASTVVLQAFCAAIVYYFMIGTNTLNDLVVSVIGHNSSQPSPPPSPPPSYHDSTNSRLMTLSNKW